MSLFRMTFRLLPRSNIKIKSNLLLNLNTKNGLSSVSTNISQQRSYSVFMTNRHCVPTMSRNVRTIAFQDITKSLQLISSEPRNVDKDPNTLKLKTPIEKPLVLILSWLLGKQKHIAKYAQIYLDQGFDCLVVSITPWELLWPKKGTQIVAQDVVKFLTNNKAFNPLLIHGFSVGGYMWGECNVIFAQQPEAYKEVSDRILGHIWDSAADITEIPFGVPKALFPRNATMQTALKAYMQYHMKTFHEQATSHYIRSSQMFHTMPVKSPALFLLSKSDPVGAYASNNRVRESWESHGVTCTWKCWDRSPHVQHFYKHREEYLEAVYNHLNSLNLVKYPERIMAKAKL